MQQLSIKIKAAGRAIGFVPTMGYLHEGHLSLIKKSKAKCSATVVSIFVNPTQFAPNEDLSKYPRDIKGDKKKLIAGGVDYLFYPDVNEIYPVGFQSYIEVNDITKIFEGVFRPNHFRGVTTIVSILFNTVMPNFAFFGQKDAQQTAVIKRMVQDLKLNLKIIVCPIVREKDGLALSSRNIYLSEKERKDALVLSKSLRFAKQLVTGGESDAENIISRMKEIIYSVDTSNLDYIGIVNAETFMPVKKISTGSYYVLIACRIGSTRLIDNILIYIP